jgi:hypothetical protein
MNNIPILKIRNENHEWCSIPAIIGQSAYQIALKNGFKGTEQEWLLSLSPYIGENGNWYINDIDTGVIATPELEDYYSKEDLISLTPDEILNICKD